MILDHQSYRAYLKDALAVRRQKNPAHSMRAFARQVGLTQSALSQVISGKKNLSAESALRVAHRLGLKDLELECFNLMVEIERTRDPSLKESLLKRLRGLNPKREVHDLSVELFRLISDWHHLAIRNALDLDDPGLTPRLIAKRLGIPRLDAEVALERLERLELVERDPSRPSGYRKTREYVLAKSESTNQALRNFHRQMLEKAIESLQAQSPQEKIVGLG